MVPIKFDDGVYGFKPEDDDSPVSAATLTASGWSGRLVESIASYIEPYHKGKVEKRPALEEETPTQ